MTLSPTSEKGFKLAGCPNHGHEHIPRNILRLRSITVDITGDDKSSQSQFLGPSFLSE